MTIQTGRFVEEMLDAGMLIFPVGGIQMVLVLWGMLAQQTDEQPAVIPQTCEILYGSFAVKSYLHV